MIGAVCGWWLDLVRNYVGNAQAVRDFRSQLRGSRPVILWGAYLAILVGTVGYMYTTSLGNAQGLEDIQHVMVSVYQALMALLGITVTLAAPALTANSITQERQRRSLDLIACAPVPTKYFLIGKMLSSFRYLWMLLILALPATAFCVIFGGASWLDVLASYSILAGSGVMFTSISLLISSKIEQPIRAVGASYGVIVGIVSPLLLGISGAGFNPMDKFHPWYAALTPLATFQTAPFVTSVFGTAVPTFLFSLLFYAVVTRYFVLATGAAMSYAGSKDLKRLRAESVVHWGIAWALAIQLFFSHYVSPESSPGFAFGHLLCMAIAAGGFVVSVIAAFAGAYDNKGSRMRHDDGGWNLKKLWEGTPAAGLPYALLLFLVQAIAVITVFMLNGHFPDAATVAAAAWGASLIFAVWALYRRVSAKGIPLKQTYMVGTMIQAAAHLIPLMLLTIIFSGGSPMVDDFTWLVPASPILKSQGNPILIWTALWTCAGLVLTQGAKIAKAEAETLRQKAIAPVAPREERLDLADHELSKELTP